MDRQSDFKKCTHTDKEGDTHTHKDRNTEKEQVGVGEGREEARSCVLSF